MATTYRQIRFTPYFSPPSLAARYARLTPQNRANVRSRARADAMHNRSSCDVDAYKYAILSGHFPRAYTAQPTYSADFIRQFQNRG